MTIAATAAMQAFDEWMARMLAPQLRVAAGSSQHEAAVYYGFRRLDALRLQAISLSPAGAQADTDAAAKPAAGGQQGDAVPAQVSLVPIC